MANIGSCGAGIDGECQLSECSHRTYGMALARTVGISTPMRPALAEESPCRDMHQYGSMMHMRTTMILDDELIDEARRLTGLSEKTAIVHAGLEALIARESARRLANLGGSDVRATAPPRRRLAPRRGR
jgi:Arc/MetJ family transcription regulator